MSDLRQRLKAATQPLHDQVEATNVMSRLMRDDLSRDQYAATLARMHALYVPLESHLVNVPGLTEILPDLPRRLKVASLAADLDALGTSALAPVPIAPVTDVPAALGTLYVLEGSTMGGRLIANALRTRPFVSPAQLNFFGHYGADAGRMWQTFVKSLERVDEADHHAATDAAIRTFGYFLELDPAR